MSWLLALFLTAGFAKLVAIGLNWLLSIPQAKYLIVANELCQFLLFVIYFVVVLCHMDQRSPLALTLFTIGVIGLVLLLRATIAYQLYSPPRCQIQHESKTVDFRQSTAHQPWRQTLVGPGPMRGIALLPGNEQFTVDISVKSYQMPRLPAEWDGLSVVHLTDTHYLGAVSRQYFEAVCEQAINLQPDLFAFTGDLLDDPALLDWLPETLGRLKAPLGQYFILGNHDWYQNADAIRQEFVRCGWTDLAGRSLEIPSRVPGSPIVIAGDESPWMGVHPQFDQAAGDHFRVLLSHTPDNINWAREQGIDLMLAGHTHGGQICLPILGPIYSPSRFGCRFAAGVFWLEPTLLYVSRGLSGREPIRYLCPPELTKIVLKTTVERD